MLFLWLFRIFLFLCLSLIRYFLIFLHLWAGVVVITNIVDICLVLKIRLVFKMVMFSVIERWDFFITSSSSKGIINMFHPDQISRALLSTQSTILESSFLFGWGSVSSAAKRCSCVSLCLFCASTQRYLTGIPTPVIPVQNGRWGESATVGQRWKASMWLATWEQHLCVLAAVCETTS